MPEQHLFPAGGFAVILVVSHVEMEKDARNCDRRRCPQEELLRITAHGTGHLVPPLNPRVEERRDSRPRFQFGTLAAEVHQIAGLEDGEHSHVAFGPSGGPLLFLENLLDLSKSRC